MVKWQSIPLLKIALPLILGVLFAKDLSLHPFLVWGITACLLLVLFLIHAVLGKKRSLSLHSYCSLLILLVPFGFGVVLQALVEEERFRPIQEEKAFVVKIHDQKLTKSGSVNAVGELSVILTDGWKSAKGKVQLFIEQDTLKKLYPGMLLLCRQGFQPIQAARHPFEFNPKVYYESFNIHAQAFIPVERYVIVNEFDQKFAKALLDWRAGKLRFLDACFANGNHLGIIKALTLADKSELKQETKTQFAATGISHVLAVSGLHVGVIFLMLTQLIKLRGKVARYTQLGFAVLVIWMYAFIAGAAPPVVRASIMISALLVAELFQRPYNGYNALVFSALIIVMLEPESLGQLSFQFSFLAMWSILFYYPLIRKWLRSSNRIVDKACAMAALSLSAQLLTLPLSFYYFHMFPTYFLLANLTVVFYLIATFHLGLLLVLIGPYHLYIQKTLSTLLDVYLEFALWLTQRIVELPQATIVIGELHQSQLILIYIVVGVLTLILLKKWSLSLYMACGIAILFILLKPVSQKTLISFQYKHKPVVIFISNKQAYVVADVSVFSNPNFHQFSLQPLLLAQALKEVQCIPKQMLQRTFDFDELICFSHGVCWFAGEVFLLDQTNKED